MATYDVGDRARLNLALTDITGAPADGTVVLTVTSPAGATSTPAVTNTAVGSYYADVDLSTAGRWSYRWVSTGAVIAAESGVLEVRAATAAGIVSLADVKAHLNETTTANDDELRLMIDAATEWVEARIGPVATVTVTGEQHPASPSGVLVLDKAPVVSVTSVTDTYGYGYTFDTSTMVVDGAAGIVRTGAYAQTFTVPVSVSYTAGRGVVPASVRLAALEVIRGLWASQRGPGDLEAMLQGDTTQVAGDLGSTLGLAKWRAEQLLQPYALPPSVA